MFREAGVRDELTLADLSDGSLRFLCWATLKTYDGTPLQHRSFDEMENLLRAAFTERASLEDLRKACPQRFEPLVRELRALADGQPLTSG
jgi:predicted ATPase